MVTAVEQARKLPEQLADLPITAASRAVQAGMRVQQRVTELAIKGDEVFSLLRPVEDTPPWARFDEDDAPPAADTEAGAGEPGVSAGTRPDSRDGEVDEADVAQALTPAHPGTDGNRPATASGPPPAKQAPPAEPAKQATELLAGYEEMSVAELRTKLRALSLPQLEALLVYEQAHRDRPAFVTLLSNRISTVRSQ
jgi:hypothetical protein